MVDGIVLAGGYSSRAKTNKMTLEYEGKPLIMHAIDTLRQVSRRIIVVTGHYHDELMALLQDQEDLVVVYNRHYAEGMFSSIQAGVEVSEHDFFIIPGDCPNIKPTTYKALLDAPGDIRVPSYSHHLGHPIYFSQKYKPKLLTTTHNNLKAFRNDHLFTIVEVDDPGITADIDTLHDYHRLTGKDD